ncbi:type I restriction endonuclease subunit R [Serinicoccus profundi]|uniref:type I restriction endonuclease subunit R n=1 Tax=Serinicoccus profundi TaxID=1078471 RepID=UPI000255E8FB|nr:type I restriction endonuclease subunit R [Serinicoccus profundi]
MVREVGFSEDAWEQVALEELAEYEWKAMSGVDIAPGSGERQSWDDPVIQPRVMAALTRLNPDVPTQHLQQAMADILAPKSQDAITENHRIHGYLVHGYRGISYIDTDGSEQNPTIRLLSDDPDHNDYLAVNQVTVRVGDYQRRFDIVLYLNGMPVAVIELKKGGNHRVGAANAHAQLATYLRELPMAFRFCVLTVASDGLTARYGTPFTPLNHFSPWNVDDDGQPVVDAGGAGQEASLTGIEQLIAGVFNTERFGHLLRDFTAFDNDSDTGLAKRIAKPHQYFAVTKAVGNTIDAVRSNGKAGVVWHTQGSGKSMEMELYTAKVLTHPALLNPTVIVITDRKELDGQLFDGFKRSDLLPEEPVTIRTRSQLRDEVSSRVTGGVYFTTLQKFGRSLAERQSGIDHPLLSDRRNIIVIVDEAHRSHYDDLDGYARHLKDALPNATLIAFTGTPISFADRNTRAVFGDYIDVYDLSRAVADEATVPVHFEARLIQMGLAEQVSEEDIDRAADEATVGVDLAERERLEKSVAVINAVYGAPARIEALAADIVTHWEQRRDQMAQFIEAPGKAMIVGATRHICAALYEEIIRLRPEWHHDDLDQGRIKVVYSGDAPDPEQIVRHVRRESENATIKERLRQVDDELEIVIVKDMMLTGYDSQPLHTLYLDRPLKGALLMQTLARVNRTFRGKQDGLLVAYAPLAENLNQALAEYSAQDQSGKPMGRNIDEAAALAETLVAQLNELCAGHPWRDRIDPQVRRSWMDAALGLANYLRSPHTPGNDAPEGEKTLGDRFRELSGELARSWALSSGSQTLEHLRGEILFYQETRVYMAKMDAEQRQAAGEPIPEEIHRLLSDIVAASTATGEIVDIYEAAGIPRPSLADLDGSFVAQMQDAKNPHLAIEALRAMLTSESSRVSRHNLVRQRAFSDRITELMNRYTNQQLTSAEVISELIALAKEVAAEASRGESFDPVLSEDELAFYDAVAQNESAVEVMGDDVLAKIARDLLAVMRRDIKTDWTVRDDVRAKLRSSIKRLLVLHRYPPDKQPEAIRLVIDQMEAMAPRYAERKAS